MKWNSRNDWFDPNGGNGRESFKKHDESMREFRRSHANVAMVNGSMLDEAALLERMESLQVSHTMMETGGSALPSDITDRSALVPVLKVAGYKLSQN
jgi:riboflavin biosynthesis pyrimidine reductase